MIIEMKSKFHKFTQGGTSPNKMHFVADSKRKHAYHQSIVLVAADKEHTNILLIVNRFSNDAVLFVLFMIDIHVVFEIFRKKTYIDLSSLKQIQNLEKEHAS